jgi:hypothetical protein
MYELGNQRRAVCRACGLRRSDSEGPDNRAIGYIGNLEEGGPSDDQWHIR